MSRIRLEAFCLTLTLCLLATSPVMASGGVTCTADDGQVTVVVAATLDHGAGSNLSNPQGRILIKAQSIPADMRKFDLSQGLIHHWMTGGEAKLHYYFERAGNGPVGTLELIVDTKDDPQGAFAKGKYVVKSHDMTPPAEKDGGKDVELSGSISCQLE